MDYFRNSVLGKARFLFLVQILLVLFMAREAFQEKMLEKYKTPPSGIELVLTRFLCAIFLHISLSRELNQSFVMMKYANNHHWKFNNWATAWSIGFM